MSLPHQSTVITPPRQLPNEIMALFFSFITDRQSTLYQCTLVNKTFYELANPLLWHSPQLTNRIMATRFFEGMVDMPNEQCNTLGQLIHDLSLDHKYTNNRPWSKAIDLIGQDLQVLYFLPLLLRHMPNLQHLTLSNCIVNEVLCHLQHCRLTCLKLHKSLVTFDGFEALARCPLEDFEWITKGSESSVLLQYLKPCPLRRLAVHYTIKERPIHSQMLSPIAQLLMDSSTFPQLTILELSGCPGINDQVLTAFFKNHPLLEQLHLCYQYITDATLDAMKLPRLTHASLTHLEHIATAAVRRLISTCPLTYLDVSHSYQVDTTGCPAFVVKKRGESMDIIMTQLVDERF